MQQSTTQSIYLSKKERIGLISLIALLGIGIILPIILSQFNKNPKMTNIIAIENNTKEDSIQVNKLIIHKKNFHIKNKSVEIENKNLVVNPNHMNLQQAVAIGLSEKNYKTIQKYLATGAEFKSVNDLKKIYGLKESTFIRIFPHIFIPSEDSLSSILKREKEDIKKNLSIVKTIEINTANIEEFKSLPGIGNKLAERILKFRAALGGFLNISQLQEVYGIHDTTFNKISKQVFCTPSITKTKINSSDIDELNAHPYINFKQAEFIVQYRRQNGSIKNFEELSQTNYFTVEWLKKIEAYIDFQ